MFRYARSPLLNGDGQISLFGVGQRPILSVGGVVER